MKAMVVEVVKVEVVVVVAVCVCPWSQDVKSQQRLQ